jgi:hypothetical protein
MRLVPTRRTLALLTAAAALVMIGIPATARADGFVSPWAGVQFGGTLQNVGDIDRGKGAFGVTAGAMGGGIIGGEFDFGYGPNALGSNTSMLDFMGNLIIGVPIGGQSGGGVRPYVSGGVGLLRSQVDSGTVFNVTSANNQFGWDLGGGVMGFFGDHFGLRGDFRFMRTFDQTIFGITNVGHLNFTRLSLGVVFR